MVRGVLVVLSFFLATQTGLSQRPCTPPCDLEALYLESCRNVNVSSTACMRAWDAFLSAFSGKDPSTVTQADYNNYFQVLPIVVVRNHALFWSGTFALAQGISSIDPSICSSFTEPSAASVSGVGEYNECWCGNLTTPGVDCANECNGVPVTQFWVSFSTMLGQMAEGVVFWLAWGERLDGTYQSNSFFAKSEFSALESPRVSRLVVLNVHNRGVGESCGNGTLRILEGLSEAKFGSSGYMCYDVYGSASLMDMAVVRNIVNIIHMEQSDESGGDSHANGTVCNNISQSGIIAAVCTCQLEVILVAIVTGLIVHFVTKHVLQHKTSSNQDRSGNTAEPFNPVQNDDATYDTACLGDPNSENVKMQPSPAYQAIPECL